MSKFPTVLLLRTLALSVVVASAALQGATVDVTAVVTPTNGLFQYDYSVANSSGADLFDLDIAVAPGIAISNLTAPAGFKTAYDPVLGLVSFLENTGSFGSAPISGFIFDSAIGPSPTTFTGNLQDLKSFQIVTISGTTPGPVVPEPSSLAACALGGAVLLFWRKSLLASRR